MKRRGGKAVRYRRITERRAAETGRGREKCCRVPSGAPVGADSAEGTVDAPEAAERVDGGGSVYLEWRGLDRTQDTHVPASECYSIEELDALFWLSNYVPLIYVFIYIYKKYMPYVANKWIILYHYITSICVFYC